MRRVPATAILLLLLLPAVARAAAWDAAPPTELYASPLPVAILSTAAHPACGLVLVVSAGRRPTVTVVSAEGIWYPAVPGDLDIIAAVTLTAGPLVLVAESSELVLTDDCLTFSTLTPPPIAGRITTAAEIPGRGLYLGTSESTIVHVLDPDSAPIRRLSSVRMGARTTPEPVVSIWGDPARASVVTPHSIYKWLLDSDAVLVEYSDPHTILRGVAGRNFLTDVFAWGARDGAPLILERSTLGRWTPEPIESAGFGAPIRTVLLDDALTLATSADGALSRVDRAWLSSDLHQLEGHFASWPHQSGRYALLYPYDDGLWADDVTVLLYGDAASPTIDAH